MNAFKQAREKKKMRQEDVAKHLGINRSTVAQWERGVAYPRAKTLAKVAKLYGCKLETLLRQ